MDRATIIAVGTAAGTVLAALSSHGTDALKALAGVPALLQAWSSGLPLGLWSFTLASVLSVMAWVAAIRWLPVSETGKAPFGKSNLIALLVGVAITLTQQLAAPDRGPGDLLNALCLGLIAGGLAPHVGTLLRGKVRSKPTTPEAGQ
jgi:hypothetical protein